MTQRANVNTTTTHTQANVVIATSTIIAIRQQLADIDDHALTAQTLGEIAFEILDDVTVTDPAVHRAITRLDALFKSAYRTAILAQESVAAISLLLEEAEGGAA